MDTTIAYLLSKTILTNLGHTPNKREPLLEIQKTVLSWSSLYGRAIANDGTGLTEDFSGGDQSFCVGPTIR